MADVTLPQLGETVTEGATLYTIADLADVWVDLNVPKRHQARVTNITDKTVVSLVQSSLPICAMAGEDRDDHVAKPATWLTRCGMARSNRLWLRKRLLSSYSAASE